MKALRALVLAAVVVVAGAGWVSSRDDVTAADVNLGAGPGSDDPVVTTVPEGREVFIHGCLSDFDWCDVSWRRNRGSIFNAEHGGSINPRTGIFASSTQLAAGETLAVFV